MKLEYHLTLLETYGRLREGRMVILVTGGAGFIGSLLIRELAKEYPGETIRILDNMSRETWFALKNLPENANYELIIGDIRKEEDLRKAMKDVDLVFHLAAITNAPLSFERKETTKQVNWIGTKKVAEFALKNDAKLIYTSTASVYGPTSGLVKEDHPCKPASPYAEYKLLGEKEILKLCEQGLKATILRLATNYGFTPGFRMEGIVINRFVFRACFGNPITVYGTGEQKRPFIHVKDSVRALLFTAKNQEKMNGEIYNVVGQNLSVNQIVECIRKFIPKIEVVHIKGTKHLTELSYEMDGTKIEKLGFKPKFSVEDGIKELIDKLGGLK